MVPPWEPKWCGRPAIDVKNIVLCCLITKKGRIPYIKPKSNTRVKAKGVQAWWSMIHQPLDVALKETPR